MMVKVVNSGARGATIGRNAWGGADPTSALVAFRAVIHDGASPGAALKMAGAAWPVLDGEKMQLVWARGALYTSAGWMPNRTSYRRRVRACFHCFE
jgi:hypothetical protein